MADQTLVNRKNHDRVVEERFFRELANMGYDLSSSASRQHYIDTGRYLLKDELVLRDLQERVARGLDAEDIESMFEALEALRSLHHDISNGDVTSSDIAESVYSIMTDQLHWDLP